jgi:formamidopyrimidine-DNA glycosylase
LAAELEKYGREPVNRDFTLEFFCEVMKKRPNKRIKEFLLEQKLIAGIGNIYADESLYRAKIKPTRRVKTLRRKEKQALYQAVKYILNKAIKHRGTSVSDYVNSEGGVGQFQNYLKVYGCGGKACVKCKTIISKIKLGSRSASFCPVCQK